MIQQYSATSYASDSPPCEIQQHFRRSCDPMRTITMSISHQSCSYMMPFKFDVQKKSEGYDPARNASTRNAAVRSLPAHK